MLCGKSERSRSDLQKDSEPADISSLGRHEDLIRIDDVRIVDILPAQETTLDMCAYAPATAEIPGTVYTVHKDYTISKGKRRFNDVRVKYLDRGTKVITDCDNLNNPCFFI